MPVGKYLYCTAASSSNRTSRLRGCTWTTTIPCKPWVCFSVTTSSPPIRIIHVASVRHSSGPLLSPPPPSCSLSPALSPRQWMSSVPKLWTKIVVTRLSIFSASSANWFISFCRLSSSSSVRGFRIRLRAWLFGPDGDASWGAATKAGSPSSLSHPCDGTSCSVPGSGVFVSPP